MSMSGAEEFVTYDAGGRLVRGRMIELTAAEGGELVTDNLQGKAHLEALKSKIGEEATELTPEHPEEAVDIIQAALDYAALCGLTAEEVEELRLKKLSERGGFMEGVVAHIAKVRRGSEADQAYAAQPERFERIDR